MKTMPVNRPGRFLSRTRFGTRLRCAVAVALLGLATASVFAGATVSWIGGGPAAGYVDGYTNNARYYTPCGLAIDPTGDFLYIANRDNNAVRVIQFDIGQTYTLPTYTNFVRVGNLFSKPVGVALDSAGDVYVLDYAKGTNGNVLEFNNYDDEVFELVATNLSGLTNAGGIAVDANNNLYVTASNRTSKFPPWA